MLRNLDTLYYKPDLVRISLPKLISARTFFGSTVVGLLRRFCFIAPIAFVGGMGG